MAGESSAAHIADRPCSATNPHESHVYWLGGNVDEAGRSYRCPGRSAAQDCCERLARIFPVGPDCPCRDIDDCKPCREAGYCVVDADLYRAERGVKS